MRTQRSAYFAIVGTIGLMAGAVAQTPAPRASSERTLTPVEQAILLDPCPSESATRTLVRDLLAHREYRRRLALLPPSQRPKTPDDGGMGWTMPDAEYWRRIPAGARAIPQDWSGLLAIRFLNTQVDGERDVCLAVQGDYDLWLLHDPMHDLSACLSVHRPTRRVWFMEITRAENGKWIPKRAKDPCYSCHPSGPRLIRPLAQNRVDRARLALFNRRMLSYGACDFGDSVNAATCGAPIADARCSSCHNGVDRGRLFAIHDRVIRFKTEQEVSMPPTAETASAH